MTPLLTLLLACGLDNGNDAYTGTIEITEIGAATTIGGRLLEVLPREGDSVALGDVLFRVDPTRLEAEVALREAQVAQAAAAREAAQAQVYAAWAQVSTLEREHERLVALEGRGVASAQQTSQLSGQLAVARAQASAAKEMVEQAEAAGRQAEAGLAAANTGLAETEISATLDAVVLSRNREPGEVTGPGVSVLTLGDLANPRLRVYVPLVRVEQLSIGDPVAIDLDAGQATGAVARIAAEAEFTPRDILTPDERVKRVFAVDIDVEPGPGVHPGMPAEARIGAE